MDLLSIFSSKDNTESNVNPAEPIAESSVQATGNSYLDGLGDLALGVGSYYLDKDLLETKFDKELASTELAGRLNLEAAQATAYGEEAKYKSQRLVYVGGAIALVGVLFLIIRKK